MTVRTIAHSISRAVQEQLLCSQASHLEAHVLAVFEHACDLVTHAGDVVALVTSHAGNGPLNIVVDDSVVDSPAGLFAGLEPGEPATLAVECLWVGGLRVDLGRAVVWEPRPDWDTLRARRDVILSSLPFLRDLCLCMAPAGSLLDLENTPAPPVHGTPAPPVHGGALRAIFSAAQRAAEALREGWEGNLERLHEGALGLAGLGSGLTPAGDDFLTGTMLWAWLAHPVPAPFCRALVEAAIPRTTVLSAAFLRAAARGECSASWHGLLEALGEGVGDRVPAPPVHGGARIASQHRLFTAVQEIMAHGATSGADSLAGLLYASEF
ncbi:MAG TPA: DUF2877 domain-containing protein [Anaerolineae bacterium]|nr:DUF2877 domain-containing protein [Anaerolineae bacterium]